MGSTPNMYGQVICDHRYVHHVGPPNVISLLVYKPY